MTTQEIQNLVNLEKLPFDSVCNLMLMVTESLRVCKQLNWASVTLMDIHDTLPEFYAMLDELSSALEGDVTLFHSSFTPPDLNYIVYLISTSVFNRM